MLQILQLLLLWASPAAADAPKRPPATYRVHSPNGAYFAEVDATRKRTTIFQAAAPKKPLWSVEGWFRVAALANDGQTLVTGYDGVNLLPAGFSDEQVLLTFHRPGGPVKTVTLRQLVPDRNKLRKTASHYYWGEYLGFDPQGRYRVKTATGEIIAFDPATGERTR